MKIFFCCPQSLLHGIIINYNIQIIKHEGTFHPSSRAETVFPIPFPTNVGVHSRSEECRKSWRKCFVRIQASYDLPAPPFDIGPERSLQKLKGRKMRHNKIIERAVKGVASFLLAILGMLAMGYRVTMMPQV